MIVQVIRVDGTVEVHDDIPRGSIRACQRLIGADCLDTVNLGDGRVMFVDDTGMVDGRPINPEATTLYHAVRQTPYSIHGDVAIVVDADFE